MEIKIVITDAGPAAAKESTITVGDGSGGAAGTMAQAASPTGGATAPVFVTAQDRAGAIDAGPAPAAASGAAGAPETFVGQRAANVLGPAGGTMSTDESGGAAPGSEAGMATFTSEAQHG